MQTEALQSPWTPRQRAVLSSEEGAESVVDAVARVDRLSEVRRMSTTVSHCCEAPVQGLACRQRWHLLHGVRASEASMLMSALQAICKVTGCVEMLIRWSLLYPRGRLCSALWSGRCSGPVQWAFAVCSGALCIGLDTLHLLSVSCSKQLVQGKRQHVCPGVATGHCLQDLPLLKCAGRLPLC